MTIPVILEPAGSVPLRRRVPALIAVGLARVLVRTPPRRIRKVLNLASRGAKPASPAQALAARQAVVTVSMSCAGQGCLQRSVAVVLLCRLHGTWPDWCTGVRTEPFLAHAWVEVDGEPIGERDDIRAYRRLMKVSAGRRKAMR